MTAPYRFGSFELQPDQRRLLVDGRPVAAGGRAVWHLDEGEFCYAELEFLRATLAFNVGP